MNPTTSPFSFLEHCSKNTLEKLFSDENPLNIALISYFQSTYELSLILDLIPPDHKKNSIDEIEKLQRQDFVCREEKMKQAIIYSQLLQKKLTLTTNTPRTEEEQPETCYPQKREWTGFPNPPPPPIHILKEQISQLHEMNKTRDKVVQGAIERITQALPLELEKQILNRVREKFKSHQLEELFQSLEQSQLQLLAQKDQLSKSTTTSTITTSSSDQNQ